MKLLSKRSSSRTSITARSINEGKELSYQMLYNEVQRLADEEANKKKKKKIYVYEIFCDDPHLIIEQYEGCAVWVYEDDLVKVEDGLVAR